MTEQDERGEQLHAAAASRATDFTPPAVSSMTAWGRRAALIYLGVGALALAGMAVETVLGHPGTGTMFAAFLSVPWSMLVAGIAPQLPHDWPLAAGLAVRMVPLALFMLLNAAIIAGIAARSERDLTGRGTRALLLVMLAAALSSGCALTSRQRVLVAAPTRELLQFSGGVLTMLLEFDLATAPEWRDHRSSLHDVTDLSLMGDFSNPSGIGLAVPAADVTIWVNATGPSFPPQTQVWGRSTSRPTRRTAWTGTRARGGSMPTRTPCAARSWATGRSRSRWSPPCTRHGGWAAVDNFRLGATLQVK